MAMSIIKTKLRHLAKVSRRMVGTETDLIKTGMIVIDSMMIRRIGVIRSRRVNTIIILCTKTSRH